MNQEIGYVMHRVSIHYARCKVGNVRSAYSLTYMISIVLKFQLMNLLEVIITQL